MTPIIPPEAQLPVWLIGTAVAFFGWFAWGRLTGMKGEGLRELWRPAIYSAVLWPLILALLIALLPVLAITRLLGFPKPK